MGGAGRDHAEAVYVFFRLPILVKRPCKIPVRVYIGELERNNYTYLYYIFFEILLIYKCLENNLQVWCCIVLVRYIKHVLLLIISDVHGSEGYVSKYIFQKHIIRQSITSRIAFMHYIRNSFNHEET